VRVTLTLIGHTKKNDQNARLVVKWKRFQDEVQPPRLLGVGWAVIQKHSTKEQTHMQLQRLARTYETNQFTPSLVIILVLSSTDAWLSTDACMQPDSLYIESTTATLQKLQLVQNNAARIVLQAPRRSDVNSLLQTLHWLPVEQRINYKLAVLTLKTQQRHLRSIWASASRYALQRTQHSIVVRPTAVRAISTDIIARRSFSTAATLTWNSLPPAVLNCDSLSIFKSRLKTRLFSTAFC